MRTWRSVKTRAQEFQKIIKPDFSRNSQTLFLTDRGSGRRGTPIQNKLFDYSVYIDIFLKNSFSRNCNLVFTITAKNRKVIIH